MSLSEWKEEEYGCQANRMTEQRCVRVCLCVGKCVNQQPQKDDGDNNQNDEKVKK